MTQSQNDHRPDGPTLIAIAYGWAARIMTVAMEMVVPGLIGVWLDNRLGTKVVFVLLGFGGGCTLAVWHLIRMTASQDGNKQDNKFGKFSGAKTGKSAIGADETLEDK